jgi:H+/Cl- antiporter ClcA
MGATLGGAFGAFAKTILPWLNLSIPGFAIVGIAAMVGGELEPR